MSQPRPILDVARDLGIDRRFVVPYGDDKAKIRLDARESDRPPGKLVLVSAITPTRRRTIFQRKCDPRTRTSTSSPASSTCTRSSFTRVERSAGSASQYERKSCIPSKTRPVAAIAFASSGSRIHHTKGLPKAVRRRAIWYR